MGCLPTKLALRSRKVEVDAMYHICQLEEEDDFYTLVSYSYSRRIWTASSIGDQLGSNVSVVGWWNSLRSRCSKEEMETAALVL